MLAKVIGLVMSLAATGCGVASEIDPVVWRTEAIINGTRDPQNLTLTADQMLAIGYLASSGGDPFCTGTVIAPRAVVTARHCVDTRSTSGIFFGMGTMPSLPDALVPVAEKHEHPTVDFALVILGLNVHDSLPTLDPIDMHRAALDDLWLGRWVDAAGFGRTDAAVSGSDDGRYFASVEIVEYDADSVTVDGHGSQGICYGDSGGPLLWQASSTARPVIVGTEDWGDSSCVDRDYLVRTDAVADWVDAILAAPLPPLLEGCGNIDYQGICENGNALWCGNGYLRTSDCVGQGLECGWLGSNRGNYCLPASCGSIDYYGRCDGDILSWCRPSGLDSKDCGAESVSCVWESDTVGYNCGDCLLCGGACTDLTASMDHCGACNSPCDLPHADTICDAGSCQIVRCHENFRNSDDDPSNGCEQEVTPLPPKEEQKEGCACGTTGIRLEAGLVGLLFVVRRRQGRRLQNPASRSK